MKTSSWQAHPATPLLSFGLGVVLLIVGIGLVLRHVVPVGLVAPDYSLDFDHQMNGARAIARGEDPYAHKSLTLDIIEVGYAYPPLMAWVIAPLATALPMRYPYLVWVVLEMIGFACTLVMALRSGAPPVRWHWVALVIGAAFLPFVTRDNLFHGQVDFTLALLITSGLVLLSRKRPVAAGLLFAAAANVKPFLVVLLIYLAWRCRWRAFFAMGFGGAAILVVSFLPTLTHGTAIIEAWFGLAGEMGRPPFIGFLYNHSLYGTVVRMFTPTPFAVPWIESRPIYLALSAVLVLLPVAVWLWAVPPGRPRRADDPLLIFVESGLLLTLVFACGPVAEANHLLSLTPVMIAVMRLAFGSPDVARRRRWLPAAVVWIVFLVFTAGPLRWTSWTHPADDPAIGVGVLLTGKVGVLLLAAALTTAWSLTRELAVTSPHLSLRHAVGSMVARGSGERQPARIAS